MSYNAACLACPEGQKKFAKIRGLCLACYQQARKRIYVGETTWAKLAEQGKAAPTAKETGTRSAYHKRGRYP